MAHTSIHDVLSETLWVCSRHAKQLRWAMQEIDHLFPMQTHFLESLSTTEEAFISQFSLSLSRLEDAMEETLFSQVLQLSNFEDQVDVLSDKLKKLEKIGVINNGDHWLAYREMLGAFAQDYLQDSVIRAINLNKADKMAQELLDTLEQVKQFALAQGVLDDWDSAGF